MNNPTAERLLELARAFDDYRYGPTMADIREGHHPVYPWPLPGVGVVLEGNRGPQPLMTNCCCFVEALLCRGFAEANPELLFGYVYHRAFMILGDDLFSPIHAAIELGFADPLEEDEYEGDWRIVQGWNEDEDRGHTFLVVKTEAGGRMLILEANNAFAVRGVGYRGLGSLEEVGEDPEAPKAWTWEYMRRKYPKMKAAALRIG